MKNSLYILSMVAFTYGLAFAAPWWVIAVISFGLAYIMRVKPIISFIVSLVGVYAVWVFAIWYYDNTIVSNLAAELLDVSPAAVAHLSALIGGICASFFGVSGSLLGTRNKSES